MRLVFCKKIFVLIALAIFLCLPVFSDLAFAVEESGVKKASDGLKEAAEKGYGEKIDESSSIVTSLPEAIGQILGVVLSFIGVAFLLLMIYGGFTWMLARGNEQDVAKAKDLIQAAIIGLVIVFMAYAITAFVGSSLLGSATS